MYKRQGLKIKEIIAQSPLTKKKTDVKPGCIIEKVDGVAIKEMCIRDSIAGRYNAFLKAKCGVSQVLVGFFQVLFGHGDVYKRQT